MSMPGLMEWIFIAVLALLIFGPEKLPQMARSLGQTIGQLKREAQTTLDELKDAAELEELRKVGDDLRSTSRELQTQASLAGPVAGDGPRSTDGEQPTAQALIRPPFDPDAT